MARPAKSVSVSSKHFTSSEKNSRLENEKNLRGDSDKLRPPAYLTAAQKKIFRYIVKNLEASGILGNLDIYVLTECSICIDRMQTIEKQLNEKNSLDPVLISVKEKYTKAFFRYCNELCLSPQSRAKLANMNPEKEENPIFDILNDDD